MILDHLSNWKEYFSVKTGETVFARLAALKADTPEGEEKIDGDDVILKIFSYETLDPASDLAEMESHRRYLDIHTTITGAERIDWHPAASLKVFRPYDEAADEIIYAKPDRAAADLVMTPGLFALFGPSDAHRPRLNTADKSQIVKKAVMKIRIDAVASGSRF